MRSGTGQAATRVWLPHYAECQFASASANASMLRPDRGCCDHQGDLARDIQRKIVCHE